MIIENGEQDLPWVENEVNIAKKDSWMKEHEKDLDCVLEICKLVNKEGLDSDFIFDLLKKVHGRIPFTKIDENDEFEFAFLFY